MYQKTKNNRKYAPATPETINDHIARVTAYYDRKKKDLDGWLTKALTRIHEEAGIPFSSGNVSNVPTPLKLAPIEEKPVNKKAVVLSPIEGVELQPITETTINQILEPEKEFLQPVKEDAPKMTVSQVKRMAQANHETRLAKRGLNPRSKDDYVKRSQRVRDIQVLEGKIKIFKEEGKEGHRMAAELELKRLLSPSYQEV